MDKVWEYRQLILEGTLVTVELAIASGLLAVLFGLLGAAAKLSSHRSLNFFANQYTTLVRGIPELVLMMLLYFGGQQLINDFGDWTGWWGYVDLDQFIAGVMSIGFVYGAYMTETFRGAILALPRGQQEAAIACGMTAMTRFRRITWPQMVRHALPSFSNNWLVLVKATALVSVIGLHDLVWNAFVAGRATRQLFTFFLVVLVVYLLLTALSDVGLRWLERKYSVGVQKARNV